MSEPETNDCIVWLRGMPWSASPEDIFQFLGEEVHVAGGKDGIHFTTTRDGRASGEAYVELESQDDVKVALTKNNNNMGTRYIEVFPSKRSELEWSVKKSSPNTLDEGIVRLRGIPFNCSKEEIANFFSGLEIVANGIVIPVDFNGRTSGDAYVQFSTKEAAEKALEKHKERIGHRYIEIFKSSLSEMESTLNASLRSPGSAGYGNSRNFGGAQRGRPGPYDRMGYDDFSHGRRGTKSCGPPYSGQGHFVHMRGIPFRASEEDVFEFFAPLRPVGVQFIFENGGRPSGECDVEFSSHRDAQDAMAKNNAHMGTRYVELFLKSNPAPVARTQEFGSDVYYPTEYEDYGYGNGAAGVNGSYRTTRNGNGYGGHYVHMRGLPFRATEEDVYQFFEPVRPMGVRFVFDSSGRPSGECHVEFANNRDALMAMERNKANMGSRYVELFLKSPAARTPGNFNPAADSQPMMPQVPSYSTNDY